MRLLLVVLILCSVSLVISGLLFAQEYPYEGSITGDRVNLRAGAGTTHKPLAKLQKGTKVTVVGKQEVAGTVWLEVELPQEVFLYISQRYVQKKEQRGEIVTGVVKTEEPVGKVAVRTGTEADDVVLGYVNNGDTVRIRGTKDGWYHIVPPKGFTGWVSSDYVKKAAIAAPTAPKEGEQEQLERQREQIREEIDRLTKRLNEIDKTLEEENRKKKELEEELEKSREIELALSKRKEEIEKEHRARLERIGKMEKPARRYVAEGIVDDFGKLIKKPPASHRLRVSEDGDIKYYLESVDPSIDLKRYLKKRVGVNGEIEKRKWGDKEIEVIKVEFIAILEG